MNKPQINPLSLWERVGVRAGVLALVAFALSACAVPVPTAQLYDVSKCDATCGPDGETIVVCRDAKPNTVIFSSCAPTDKGVRARLERAQ